jgi:hypothetical protein
MVHCFLVVVAERCGADGGEEDAIALPPDIFSNGISEAALTRKVTRKETDKHSRGASMQVYRMLVYWMLHCEDEAGRDHYRPCAAKGAQEVLRYLKDHFGLGNGCPIW